ncbi:hypothetical protein D3C77_257050 [compost metagenome]
MGAHGAGHGAELLEVADPEVLVHVHVAVIALGGAAVGAEEAQLGTVAQRDRVAGQLDAEPLLGELDDVAAEDFRLCPAGRQEHLVVASQHGVHEGLAGEVVGQADLPALEDVADPAGEWVLLGGEQLLLVAVHFADELVEKVHFCQAADVVLGLFLPPLAATIPALAAIATRPLLPFLVLPRVVFVHGSRCWLAGLLNQPLLHRDQPIQLVQFALGEGVHLLQDERDPPADRGHRLLIRQHLVPRTLADPVVDDPLVRQLQVRLDLLH